MCRPWESQLFIQLSVGCFLHKKAVCGTVIYEQKWKNFMSQLSDNQQNVRLSSNPKPSHAQLSLKQLANFSPVFVARVLLVGFVGLFNSFFKRVAAVAKKASQSLYNNVLRPVAQKLAPFTSRLNRWILSPISQALVLAFIYCLVKPLGSLAWVGHGAAHALWDATRKILAAALRSTLYQNVCKPYFIRPTVKVARALNCVCVDFPAQVVIWLFCAILDTAVRGGVKISDVTSRCVNGVSAFSSAVVKWLSALYRAYDAFAIVPIEHVAQTSRKIQQGDTNGNDCKRIGGDGHSAAVVPPVVPKGLATI